MKKKFIAAECTVKGEIFWLLELCGLPFFFYTFDVGLES